MLREEIRASPGCTGSKGLRKGLPNNKRTCEQRYEVREPAKLMDEERAFQIEGSASVNSCRGIRQADHVLDAGVPVCLRQSE